MKKIQKKINPRKNKIAIREPSVALRRSTCYGRIKPTSKKIFKHGGSYAIDLPKSYVDQIGPDAHVFLEQGEEGELILRENTALDSIESEPEFAFFIQALAHDALSHPEKLTDVSETWGERWHELLEGVEVDDE